MCPTGSYAWNERRTYCGGSRYAGIIAAFLLAILIVNASPASGLAAEEPRETIIVNIEKINISFDLRTLGVRMALETAVKYSQGTQPLRDFTVKVVSPQLYHLRYKTWRDFFWKIDTKQHRLYRVTGGSFGSAGGAEKVIQGSDPNEISYPGPQVPAGPGTEPKQEMKTDVYLFIHHCTLTYDTAKDDIQLAVNGDALSMPRDWEVRKAGPTVYHVQFKHFDPYMPFFWKIDTDTLKVAGIKGGVFGSLGGIESPLAWKVLLRDSGALPDIVIPEDLGMARAEGGRPGSAWFDSEKKIYRNLLKSEQYDVLVVPFQVQGYAFDRIDRSLMTRYLVHRIETSTELHVPSPTLVARSLGELQRRFDDNEVFQLARDLGVRTLIRGYVGHEQDNKMRVTLIVQGLEARGSRMEFTDPIAYEWKNMPFDDDDLPSEVFRGMLDDIMTRLPVKRTKVPQIIKYDRVKSLPVPRSLSELANDPSTSAMVNAYSLQLLGTLYPEDTAGKESLFERSLVALMDISPKSPDYGLLKARAYFHLHRRPASLAALRSKRTPAEKAFAALLDGNLPELEKQSRAISDPLLRLLSQIEFVDLKWKYQSHVVNREYYELLAGTLPAWKDLILRRLDSNDPWHVQGNFSVKKMLDELLPIPELTAESLVMNHRVMGGAYPDGDDIDFSVYEHYRKLLESRGSQFTQNESGSPVNRDILDLLAETGEANLFKKLRLRAATQGAYEDALELIGRYEPIYQGHPELYLYRGHALMRLSYAKQGAASENLKKQADKEEKTGCLLFQGQSSVRIAKRSCSFVAPFANDYPRRESVGLPGSLFLSAGVVNSRVAKTFLDDRYSKVPRGDKDQLLTFAVRLGYTSFDFTIIEDYYKKLMDLGLEKEAGTLLQENRHRFQGHPRTAGFLADLREKKRDDDGARELYKQAIASSPNTWSPYERLGTIYLKQGEFRKTDDLYRSYPPFKLGIDSPGMADINTVSLSHAANGAALSFWRRGAIDHAVPFLKISSDLDTGSVSSMESKQMLSQLDGNYLRAAAEMLDLAKRYNRLPDYAEYAALLHVLGYHQEAWSLYSSRNMADSLSATTIASFIGHRMEGKTEEEQRVWLRGQKTKESGLIDISGYLLFTHLLDRMPDENAVRVVEDAEQYWQKEEDKKNSEKELRWMEEMNRKYGAPIEVSKPKPIPRSWKSVFAEGYRYVKMKKYADAAAAWRLDPAVSRYEFALPYIVWSRVKTGASTKPVDLRSLSGEHGEGFGYHLSMAILSANRKAHADAVKHLRSAQYGIPDNDGWWPLPAWYQLVETCEWLFEDSRYAGYRDVALEYAKIYQKLRPMHAWAYAVEAKHSDNAADRMRALAITLYLDKRSERIASFSQEDKNKALQWLEKSNPFLIAPPESSRSDI